MSYKYLFMFALAGSIVDVASAVDLENIPAWKRTAKESDSLASQIATCAVGKMSRAAKEALAHREHESRMARIEYRLLGSEPSDYAMSGWNSDITGPLTKACIRNINDPARVTAEFRIWSVLLSDPEYRQIKAPLDAKYRKAESEHQAAQKKRDDRERAAKSAQESWLFKNAADSTER